MLITFQSEIFVRDFHLNFRGVQTVKRDSQEERFTRGGGIKFNKKEVILGLSIIEIRHVKNVTDYLNSLVLFFFVIFPRKKNSF